MMRGNRATGRRGFTLIELVIAVCILAILAGLALPVAGKAFESKARAATRAELKELADASGCYVRDTLAFPAGLHDLWFRPDEAPGWTGPYLSYTTSDPLSGESDWTVDAWSRPYAVRVEGDVMTIRSGGPDRRLGSYDDIALEVHATPMRRAATLEQLEVLNLAVRLYNERNLPGAPLPNDFEALLDELVRGGFLPATAGYRRDAWGDAFAASPAGASPVVAIGSVNLRAGRGDATAWAADGWEPVAWDNRAWDSRAWDSRAWEAGGARK